MLYDRDIDSKVPDEKVILSGSGNRKGFVTGGSYRLLEMVALRQVGRGPHEESL